MKITFIIHSLEKMGGAEKILVLLANHFANKKYEISIILLTNSENTFELNKNIILYKITKNIKKMLLPNKLNTLIHQVNHIKSITKKQKPDILISFITATNIIATIAAKLSKTPIILSEHSSYDQSLTNARGKIDSLIWKLLRRLTYPLAEHLTILTNEDKERYHYVKNITIIQNPLVLTFNHKNHIERENIILGVGRLEHVKGFDMLIKSFQKLNLPNWKLIIAGEGSQRKILEMQIKHSNNIELIGLTQDIEYYYKKASIFVLSSRSEGFPGALCEAMGYGCAVIAFDCPTGPKEIISHNQNGILVEANNIPQLYQEINQLINDSQKRELLGEKAQEIRKKLNISRISIKWENIFDSTIKNYKKD